MRALALRPARIKLNAPLNHIVILNAVKDLLLQAVDPPNRRTWRPRWPDYGKRTLGCAWRKKY